MSTGLELSEEDAPREIIAIHRNAVKLKEPDQVQHSISAEGAAEVSQR